jgi:8-oxo-dGTP pyrophosphatase MutT (NUDIX family)
MGQTDARVLTDKTAIRDAATIIVLREDGGPRRVLMGQRGKSAAFMPSKFVFPGGAVDAVDATIPLATPSAPACATRLAAETGTPPEAVIAAATRELWEETGLLARRARPARGDDRGAAGLARLPRHRAPALGRGAEFIFRAITPPGRPRRFDARFLLARAEDLANDPDDFSRAEDELSHLQWVALDDARGFDMPFITEVVLAELSALIDGRAHPGVPFFDNSTEVSRFRRL